MLNYNHEQESGVRIQESVFRLATPFRCKS